nr:MAG TPA: hypothetical protein [Caudoviricetes sp.]
MLFLNKRHKKSKLSSLQVREKLLKKNNKKVLTLKYGALYL